MSFVPAIALLHGGEFSWTRFDVHTSVLIGCVALAAVYLWAVGPLRRRFGWSAEPAPPRRVASFLAAVALIFVALNGPLHDLSDNYLFSAHMVQHMLLMMLMPPLMLYGLPAWLVRPALRSAAVERSARFLTHPATAFVAYNIVFVGWHFPQFYNWALVDHTVHIVQHLMFMAVSVMMWWPIVNPVPELTRLGSPLQMLYLFAFGIPMSIVAAFITLSGTVVYEWYELAPRVFDLTAIDDQRLGGAIMWVPGMLVYWTAVTVIFLRWSSREERAEERARRELERRVPATPSR